MEIKITNLEAVKEAITKTVSDKVIPSALKVAQLELTDQIRELLINSFESTLVVRALQLDYTGDEERDVPAHLGLSDADAVDAAYEILETVRANIVFNRIKKIDNGAIGFVMNTKNLIENIREISTGYSDVPWMEWLLDGGEADAEIWFFHKPLSNKDGIEVSRSGRAVMREYGGSGFWDIDDYFRFVEDGTSNNFVEEAFTKEEWRLESEKLILDFIRRYFNEKRIKI